MGVLPDWKIRGLCEPPYRWNERRFGEDGPLIEPFSEGRSDGPVSSGLTSAGYDLTLGSEFHVFKNTSGQVLDLRRFDDPDYRALFFDVVHAGGGEFVMPPCPGYVLATSQEYIRMPEGLKGCVKGKSTYARMGLHVPVTGIEPGWQGRVTIELSNASPCPTLLFVGHGIAQIEFHVIDGDPEADYGRRGGKYQNQKGVTPARSSAGRR